MRGRKPTPTGLLRTRGTFRPDRHGMRQDAEGDLYAAPTGLTPAQRANWRYAIAHAPKGVLKKIDRGILKIWVEAEDRHFIAMQMQAKLDVNSELKLLVRGQFGLEPSPYNKKF